MRTSKRARTGGGSSGKASSKASGKAHLEYEGPANFRARLVLSLLSSRPVRITRIRPDDESPGLTSFEASFIRLLDKLTNGTHIEINEIGTSLFFRPGILLGGAVEHDCGGDQPGSRSAGWFLEGVLPLAPFGKRPMLLRLENCVTNDDLDPSVDTVKEVSLSVLRKFGVGADAETSPLLSVDIKRRGARPLGGGCVEFKCPTVRSVRSVDWTDGGLVKRVRGVAYSTKVSPQVSNRCVHSARGVLNALLPDVYIFTDVYSGKTSGSSPGFGLLLTAETTTGCVLSAEATALSDGGTKALPEEVATQAAGALLQEVSEGGVVDSSQQSLALLLMAVGPEDVSRLRTGELTKHSRGTLKLLRDFVGVLFKVKADKDSHNGASGTVVLSCLGSGYKNVAKQVT